MMRSYWRRRSSNRRRGIEMIELATVFPILWMVCLGIIEMGRAFEVSQVLTAAAREGARLGMLYNVVKESDRAQGITSANQKVETDIKNFLQAANIPRNLVTVLIVDEADASSTVDLDDYSGIAEQYFRVRVQVPFNDVAILPPFFLKDQNLVGEIVVRHE